MLARAPASTAMPRRDPCSLHILSLSLMSARMLQNGTCSRGDLCPYAHGVFECWLHPSKYKTQVHFGYAFTSEFAFVVISDCVECLISTSVSTVRDRELPLLTFGPVDRSYWRSETSAASHVFVSIDVIPCHASKSCMDGHCACHPSSTSGRHPGKHRAVN